MPALLSLVLLLPLTACAGAPPAADRRAPDLELPGGIAVELLTAEEARTAIVDPSDPFFAKLTPLEISLRLDEDVTALPREEALARFRTFLAGEVTDWPEDERDILVLALPRVAEACGKGCPKLLPARWRFIRSTGREESGAPYTRGDCIVLPAGVIDQFVSQSVESLGKLIVHETFHVYSRLHPKERDALYGEIGYRPVGAVALPDSIEKIRLTNPDGPGWEHAVTIADPATGEETRAIILLTSNTPVFQKAIRGVLPVLQFHLYPLTGDEPPRLRLDDAGAPVRFAPFTVPSLFAAVGRNTGYIIHPDEVLADNAALLAYPAEKPPTPELLERLAARLGGEKKEATEGAGKSAGPPAGMR